MREREGRERERPIPTAAARRVAAREGRIDASVGARLMVGVTRIMLGKSTGSSKIGARGAARRIVIAQFLYSSTITVTTTAPPLLILPRHRARFSYQRRKGKRGRLVTTSYPFPVSRARPAPVRVSRLHCFATRWNLCIAGV